MEPAAPLPPLRQGTPQPTRPVGAQLARLGGLVARGWPVPDGYVITARALEDALGDSARQELNHLFDNVADGFADLDARSTAARQLIEAESLPAWLEDAVSAAHSELELRTGLG